MKIAISFLAGLLFSSIAFAQNPSEGKIVYHFFSAPSIEKNQGGEDPQRRLTIYTPPGYESGNTKYPTIYFLHGFDANDSLMAEWLDFKHLMDTAITSGIIQPMILVLPNSNTLFHGSFYTNSTLTGNWADYIGKDVVQYIDKNYRTLADRNSRGLAGHSMGGNGALKIGMLYPDTFGAVYALSPAILNWAEDFTWGNPGLKKLSQVKNESDLQHILNNPTFDEKGPTDNFLTLVMASVSRTYSPNKKSIPLLADLPVHYLKDSIILNPAVITLWEENFPVNMIGKYLPALKNLNALKLDWGRNENFPHIPITALQFSKKLEGYGIKHFAEEYIGDHVNMLDGKDGRIFTELLPFFNAYLKFK